MAIKPLGILYSRDVPVLVPYNMEKKEVIESIQSILFRLL